MNEQVLESTPVIYSCGNCDRRFIANTQYESDKPNGFYIDVRMVTGMKFCTHAKTPAPVFFCTHQCMMDALENDVMRMLEPTRP